MATKQQIRWSELKVGVLVIIALAILSAIIIMVLGVESPFAARYTLYTSLPNIGGLRPDSPVMLEGVTVGSVDSFDFSNSLEGGVRVKMRIQRKYQDRIRTDSIAKLRSLGLLGDKYIEINEGTPAGRTLQDGEMVAGAPPLDLDQMIARATHTFDNLSDTVDNIKVITQGMEQGKGTVGHLLEDPQLYSNLNGVLEKVNNGKGTAGSLINDNKLYHELTVMATNLRQVTDKIGQGQGPAGKILTDEQLGKSLENSINQLESILTRMQNGQGALGKLSTDPALYNNLNDVAADLKPVAEKLASGQGTMGQLMTDKKLYDNLNKAVAELQGLISDIRKDPKKYLRIKFSIF